MFILNLLIDGLILWAGSKIAPDVVQIGGFGTLVLATVLLSVVTFLVMLACLAIAGIGALCENLAWAIIGVVAVFFSGIIAMSLLSSWLPGFAIIGFWPKAIIAICFSIFELSKPKN
jgi:uncharacterized membrane protein YvlD (DUF360 family)